MWDGAAIAHLYPTAVKTVARFAMGFDRPRWTPVTDWLLLLHPNAHSFDARSSPEDNRGVRTRLVGLCRRADKVGHQFVDLWVRNTDESKLRVVLPTAPA